MVLKYKGYMDKILRVNLTNKKISKQSLTDDLVEKYLGGTGFAIRLFYDEVPPETDPLGPNNKVAMLSGPINGTRIAFSGKMGMWSKSPLTEKFYYSSASARISAEMKYAGYDGFVLEGRSEKPVYLFVDDDEVQFKDASGLLGKDTRETRTIIREDLGDDEICVSTIGPAGEKLVRFAAIESDYSRMHGRGGMGAVWGSKNLKAIAVRGYKSVDVADPDGLYEWIEEINAELAAHPSYIGSRDWGTAGRLRGTFQKEGCSLGTRNWQEEWDEKWNINFNTLRWREKYVTKNVGCYACPSGCAHVSRVPDGPYAGSVVEGPEYETFFALGTMVDNDRHDVVIEGNRLCDALGLDTITAGTAIAFAMELYEKGIITSKDTGGLELNWGDPDAIIGMIKKIAYREDLGDILAEGTWRAAKKIGKGTEKYSMTVKGLEFAGHSPRILRGVALGYSTAVRGATHHDYHHTSEYGAPEGGKDFRGHGCPTNRFETRGKPQWVRDNQRNMTIQDCMGLCHMNERLYGFDISERYADMVRLVTGLPVKAQDLVVISDRVWQLERAYNVRCGVRRKTGNLFFDDWLPDRSFESLTKGPLKDKPGHAITPKELNWMLDQYYGIVGWDKETGIPTAESMLKLGLNKAEQDLKKLRSKKA